jgi:hypothetical protein
MSESQVQDFIDKILEFFDKEPESLCSLYNFCIQTEFGQEVEINQSNFQTYLYNKYVENNRLFIQEFCYFFWTHRSFFQPYFSNNYSFLSHLTGNVKKTVINQIIKDTYVKSAYYDEDAENLCVYGNLNNLDDLISSYKFINNPCLPLRSCCLCTSLREIKNEIILNNSLKMAKSLSLAEELGFISLIFRTEEGDIEKRLPVFSLIHFTYFKQVWDLGKVDKMVFSCSNTVAQCLISFFSCKVEEVENLSLPSLQELLAISDKYLLSDLEMLVKKVILYHYPESLNNKIMTKKERKKLLTEEIEKLSKLQCFDYREKVNEYQIKIDEVNNSGQDNINDIVSNLENELQNELSIIEDKYHEELDELEKKYYPETKQFHRSIFVEDPEF